MTSHHNERERAAHTGDHQARRSLIELGRWVDQRGWCPATGGNFSVRLNGGQPSCVVTASGVHKGALELSDFIEVDLNGAPLDPSAPQRPSAETLVHVALYRCAGEVGAVIHTHSVLNTVLSRATQGDALTLQGWEMQKSLAGVRTHEGEVSLSIFENTQDMGALSREVEARWRAEGGLRWGLLVRGHGLYTWGQDLAEARRHLEGIEFLLSCHLELMKLSATGTAQ